MNLYQILRMAHSGWRYIVFAMLVIAFLSALINWIGKKPFSATSKKINLFTLISMHIQILIGLVLYFLSPLVEAGIRYWKMEHIGLMIVAAVMVTIGNARSKKGNDDTRHRSAALYFGLALIVVIMAIYTMTMVDPSRTFFGTTK